MKIECPQCHSFFRVVTESKKLVEDEKVEEYQESKAREVEDALEALNPIRRKGVPFSKYAKDVETDDLTYELTFRCKKCGHEWTELEEKGPP